jgi:hypothetical protein
MSNTRDAHNVAGIVNDVHDTPISDAYPPMILVVRQFLGSGGPWLTGESLDFPKHASKNVIWQAFKFLPSRRLNLD